MGFYTNITISNDFWHEIAKDPEKLIEGINIAMNYGTNSPLGETLDAKSNHEHLQRHRHELKYSTTPQGVIVHHARHADEPQVIVNTYGSQAVAASEVPAAIRLGWLDLNPYNKAWAENMAQELNALAQSIRKAIKEVEKDEA